MKARREGRVIARRRGFVLLMWTGPIESERTGRPILFGTIESARRYIGRLPSWGRQALEIWACSTRPGSNGLPDYVMKGRVS